MTICKLLAKSECDNVVIESWEKWDKLSAVPRYEIVCSVGGMVTSVNHAARTTWKRKFKEIAKA